MLKALQCLTVMDRDIDTALILQSELVNYFIFLLNYSSQYNFSVM